MEGSGLGFEREGDPGGCDCDAVDIAVPAIAQRMAKLPALCLERGEGCAHRVLGARADAAAAREAQPAARVDHQSEHDEDERARKRRRAGAHGDDRQRAGCDRCDAVAPARRSRRSCWRRGKLERSMGEKLARPADERLWSCTAAAILRNRSTARACVRQARRRRSSSQLDLGGSAVGGDAEQLAPAPAISHSFLGPWRSGAVAMSRLRAGRCGRGRGCDQRCAACWALRARRSSTPSGHPDRARTPRDAAGDVPEYRSDADPTEDLAGVVAAKAGAFQCLRSRGRDAVAEQASVPTGRVDMDRPSPTSMLAQHTPAIVKRGGEIDWCDGRHARCRPVIVAVMPHLFSIVRHVPQLPARLRGEGPAPSITRQRSPAGCTDSGVTEASSCHLGQGWTQRTPLIVASSSSARFVDVQGGRGAR